MHDNGMGMDSWARMESVLTGKQEQEPEAVDLSSMNHVNVTRAIKLAQMESVRMSSALMELVLKALVSMEYTQ
jgi:hypothetical protein